jgi:aldehyde dehydrogenase (NAD+)
MAQTSYEKGSDQKSISLKSDWNSIYVGGQWAKSVNRQLIKDKNPYTGDIIREIPSAAAEDVEHAFTSAKMA